MYKELLMFFLILISSSSLIFAEDGEISSQDAEKYNKVGYNIYLGLLGILGIGIAVTLLLIQSNYGHKHMFQIIGFVLFIFLLFWLFRVA